ncbi:MAG TPA: hypothetical protein VFP87_01415 [Chitinophagaceae bacterium]|nr:hypothetical protein [Chitinophagaceae bacterium]
MEVHHHSQLHQPKRWTGYILEFFMIFLAVTLGFFAENIREEIINRKKEKHYLQSLAEDIKSDTAQLRRYVHFKKNVMLYCDSLLFIVSHTNALKNSNAFYNYSKEMARYVRYYPADRTIEQLRNSGTMQLITDWDVSNAIADYYSSTKSMEEVDQELNDETMRYRRYLIDFLDLSSYDQLNEPGSFMDNSRNTRGNPAFISDDPTKLKIIYNEVFTLKAFLYNSARSADSLILNGNKILTLLRQRSK